jgi:hypothetical protein
MCANSPSIVSKLKSVAAKSVAAKSVAEVPEHLDVEIITALKISALKIATMDYLAEIILNTRKFQWSSPVLIKWLPPHSDDSDDSDYSIKLLPPRSDYSNYQMLDIIWHALRMAYHDLANHSSALDSPLI